MENTQNELKPHKHYKIQCSNSSFRNSKQAYQQAIHLLKRWDRKKRSANCRSPKFGCPSNGKLFVLSIINISHTWIVLTRQWIWVVPFFFCKQIFTPEKRAYTNSSPCFSSPLPIREMPIPASSSSCISRSMPGWDICFGSIKRTFLCI